MIRLLWKCVRLVLMLGVLGIGFYFFHGVMLRPVGRYLIAALYRDRQGKARPPGGKEGGPP